MRHTLLFLSLFLAACGGGDDAGNAEQTAPSQDAAATTPAAEQPAPAAEVVDDAPPPPAGTATVTFRGPDVDISGDFPATRCGMPYFIPDQKGVTYEATFEGYRLLMADTEHRRPGPQNPDAESWHFIINGDNRTFGRTEGQPLTASFGADLKSAELRGTVSPIFKSEQYQVEVRFTCN